MIVYQHHSLHQGFWHRNRRWTEKSNTERPDICAMYELVDFGFGRKLERISGRLIDRPCPAAENIRPDFESWPVADATFRLTKGHRGNWIHGAAWSDSWLYQEKFGSFELGLSPFGHIGVFPEQANNWNWILSNSNAINGLTLLNLFAYSGGTTMATAKVAASVTHVDSARNIVNRARSNAKRSGLDQQPIRWIVEDARRFVEREIRRGNTYDGVILDPPTYGHGVSKGQHWKIEEDLGPLLVALAELIPVCKLMLCTCHSPGISSQVLRHLLGNRFSNPVSVESGEMGLCTKSNRQLPAGVFVRWVCDSSRDTLRPSPQTE